MSERLLLIGLSSGIGGIFCSLISSSSYRLLGCAFPYGTHLINAIGSFLIGIAVYGANIFIVDNRDIASAGALNEKIKSSYDTVRAKAAGKEPLQTLILLWNTPFLTINFDTYASRIIEACGGYNVFHQDPVYEIPIELEDMIEKDPQLLLLASEPFPFKKQHLKKFREYRIFSKIPLELVSGHYLSRYGPVTLEALKFFEALIQKSTRILSSPNVSVGDLDPRQNRSGVAPSS